jgi:hypothetical protein
MSTILGTRKTTLNESFLDAAAARLAHSKAISVLPVPVLNITEPLHPFFIQASAASS